MNTLPLNKNIYDKAIKLGVNTITLHFSGGSDEGHLYVDVHPYNSQTKTIEREVEEWAWSVYGYSGAGDGSDYGDDITYDLVNKKVIASEWYTTRVEGDSSNNNLELSDNIE